MIISRTPLRASFFGGGTDFAAYFRNSRFGYGTVISTALDMHVYITVNKRWDGRIRVVYSGNELVNTVDEVKHNIIREALKMTGIGSGIEIVYMADLPMTNLGVGLASSSALAVGALNALHAFKGETVSAETLAREACDLEIRHLGQEIGIQDQYAVACGGFHQYVFHSDGTVEVLPVAEDEALRDELVSRLMLFYTGKARDSRPIFKEQKETTARKKEEVLDPLVEAVREARRALSDRDLDRWGTLLRETWELKKQFASGVSNPDIDDMYGRALRAGALGGKILGAGGGGFLLLYVRPEDQDRVRLALSDFQEVAFRMDPEGSRIIYAK